MAEKGLKYDIYCLKRAMKIWREYASKYWILDTIEKE